MYAVLVSPNNLSLIHIYCHAYGVKVYLAVNTVLRDEELPAALELVAYACQLPVDAVLVQDMGLFRLIGRAAPGLPLHASTQMSIHTPAGARALQQAGATRVVLSRELSLREMKGIAANASVELEAFVPVSYTHLSSPVHSFMVFFT